MIDHNTTATIQETKNPSCLRPGTETRQAPTMKQEVFSNGGHGQGKPSSPSPSPVARTKASSRSPHASSPGVKTARRLVKASKEEKDTMVRAAKRHPHSHEKEEMKGKKKEEEEEKEAQRLRGEVDGLKQQVQRLQQLNLELEQHRRALAQELLLAQDRITHLEQDYNAQVSKKEQYLHQPTTVSNPSEECKQKEAIREKGNNKLQPTPVSQEVAAPKAVSNANPPSPPPPAPNAVPRGAPPPPPPPPRQGPTRISIVSKASALVELYNSLNKHDTKKSAVVGGDVAISPHHNGIVGELQNRSTHLLAIKADVKTKGEFISDLIKKVQITTYTDMEKVLAFVDWLDQQLSTLSDETAVLKHFNWPERKADALREAAFEYRNLKSVLTEVISFCDDGTPTSCEATLRKISNLLDKLEKSMNRLMNLRNSAMPSYKEFRIPTDWMLDSGISSKMKLASVKLAKVYMKRVLQELDREMANEVLVAQSVRFTYRAHQFAGGLDSEAMCTFEKLREWVRSQGRGSP